MVAMVKAKVVRHPHLVSLVPGGYPTAPPHRMSSHHVTQPRSEQPSSEAATLLLPHVEHILCTVDVGGGTKAAVNEMLYSCSTVVPKAVGNGLLYSCSTVVPKAVGNGLLYSCSTVTTKLL